MASPLTTAECAEMVNCSPQTIARHCAQGDIPGAVKIFKRWRIPRKAVRQLEDETAREPKTDLSGKSEKQSNGQPYEPWAIELRRTLRSYG